MAERLREVSIFRFSASAARAYTEVAVEARIKEVHDLLVEKGPPQLAASFISNVTCWPRAEEARDAA
jgi:hypothetical protein